MTAPRRITTHRVLPFTGGRAGRGEPGGPADDAGMQEGDVVVTLGEQPATSVDDLHKLLTQLPVGIPATVTLLRDGRRLERMVIPTDYPIPMGHE